MRYYVIYEPADDGACGAYPPELPGVGVVGETREEARTLVRRAIEIHLEGLRADGSPIPEPAGEFIEVA